MLRFVVCEKYVCHSDKNKNQNIKTQNCIE